MSVLDLLDAAAAAAADSAAADCGSAAGPADDACGPLAYDPAIASDGLTVDTALGPVDLVAIDRAVRGFDPPLTVAERAWIALRQPLGARRSAVAALGTGYRPWLAALARYRVRMDQSALLCELAARADLELIEAEAAEVAYLSALADGDTAAVARAEAECTRVERDGGAADQAAYRLAVSMARLT